MNNKNTYIHWGGYYCTSSNVIDNNTIINRKGVRNI